MNGTLHIHNAGRTQFTVREAGWIAADGAVEDARLEGERTLHPGGSELTGKAGASTLMDLARQHRGLTRAYVTLVGSEQRHLFPISNDWRQQLAEAASKEGVH